MDTSNKPLTNSSHHDLPRLGRSQLSKYNNLTLQSPTIKLTMSPHSTYLTVVLVPDQIPSHTTLVIPLNKGKITRRSTALTTFPHLIFQTKGIPLGINPGRGLRLTTIDCSTTILHIQHYTTTKARVEITLEAKTVLVEAATMGFFKVQAEVVALGLFKTMASTILQIPVTNVSIG